MKTLENINEEDYIAFLYRYSMEDEYNVEVAPITHIFDDDILVHFPLGFRSASEFIKKEDVIAIGDNKNGDTEFKGWSGKFTVVVDKALIEEYIKI